MERKLWFEIFALVLLLALSALALPDSETSPLSSAASEIPAGPGPALAPGTPTAGPESGSSLNASGRASESNNNTQTSPSGGLNGTNEEKPIRLIPLKTFNVTTNSSKTPDINETITEVATSPPASENQTFTTQSQPTTSSTTLSSTSKSETSPVPTPTSSSPLEIHNTSQTDDPVHIDNITSTNKPTLSTSTPATATTTTTTTANTTVAASSTTTSVTTHGSTQAPTTKQVQSDAVSNKPIYPSQLNVGKDTTAEQEKPTLDPLLAGLVSAFIIAAVIITLLLFLKLRRRDSRPEFRRLQDLPMDDMMEDTPLSMYSY